MKKTFFIAVAFVCFSNFAFANDRQLKINSTEKALKNQPMELISNLNEETKEVFKTKSEEDRFSFCYEIGRTVTESHGVRITTVYSHCTDYRL
ncbi:hypothetical protein [Flavobacterium restrictum]|uniref:Uncharacterized protein n=1 Tax=Flavobacterium restrictum TaxID=2594428 RepID=A0A553E2I6_9FLAO|nr:hypothetical protein [Flavobacterium restrictum]TRX39195.1 hypothetical protein FNW21_09680 [Flavobacterium restrictum]